MNFSLSYFYMLLNGLKRRIVPVFLGFVLGFTALLLPAFPSLASTSSTYFGHLDGVDSGKITGWAWDSADLESYAVARIVIRRQSDNSIVSDITAVASEYREDLKAAGKGRGTHGFTVPLDWSQYPDGTYTVEAYIGDIPFDNTLIYQKGAAPASSETGTPLHSLGLFKTTAYCPCRRCSEGWGRSTATGAIATSSHTIAVDPRVIPFGTKLFINGVVYTAEDRGGGVKGRHIDIFFNTHGETENYGTRTVEVFSVQ